MTHSPTLSDDDVVAEVPATVEVSPADAERTGIPVARVILGTAILVGVAAVSVAFLPPLVAGGVMIVLALVYLARRIVFSWVGWLGILVAVVMLIPIRRYALPIPLPFQLEVYRLVLVVMILGMAAAFLLDRRRKWQPIGFAWPIGLFAASLVVSIPMNGADLVESNLAGLSVGAILNWALLLSVFVIVRQIVTSEAIAVGLVTALVWCGVAVALAALFERITRINVFWRLDSFLPLEVIAQSTDAFRAGGYRSYASSQHPIALSVMFCVLIPLAIYLARYGRRPFDEWTRRIVYGAAVVVLLLGVMSAVSRTAVVVLAAMLLACLVLRPWLGVTLVALGLPAFALAAGLAPKVFDTLIGSFLDIDSLIASQETSPGFRGAGRLADLGPAIAQAVSHPFFGTGLGSRIVVGEYQNAYILDNQVLDTILETGVVGLAGMVVFIIAPIVMLLRWAFTTAASDPPYAFLAFALAVSGVGYAAALFFYDAFGFYQTLFVYFMLLAVAAWLLTASPPALAARRARSLPAPAAVAA